MKMGPRQDWNSFFPLRSNKLTESHGDNWPDETKITMLRGALNQRLRIALASNHLVPSDDYFEWVRIVGQISMQHDELARTSFSTHNLPNHVTDLNSRKSLQSSNDIPSNNVGREWGTSGMERGFVGDIDSVGDTFMGGINMAHVLRNSEGKPLREKWKTPEQIARLRNEGRCYRCEQKGCNTRICRLLPAQKHKPKGPVVSNVTLGQLDSSLYEVDDRVVIDEISESEN